MCTAIGDADVCGKLRATFGFEHGHQHHRVTFVELFFDLVFVFAITQLSHGLLKHLTPLGALQTGLLMVAVWWAWIDTTWITNWLDPETAGRADACCSPDAGAGS